MTIVRAQVGTSNGGYEESLGGLPWAAAVPLVTPEVFRVAFISRQLGAI